MAKLKTDIIFQPVRMRILVALSNQRMTAQELAQMLPDIPQATLYRHIKTLVQAGILIPIETRQAHSNLERVYAIAEGAALVQAGDVAGMTSEAQLRHFLLFLASLLDDFSRYLDQSQQPDPAIDGVRYNKGTLLLSAGEFLEITDGLRALLSPYLANKSTPERTAYIFSTTLIHLPTPLADTIEGDNE